jgi:hypothetical protein
MNPDAAVDYAGLAVGAIGNVGYWGADEDVTPGEEVHVREGVHVQAAGDAQVGIALVGGQGAGEGVAQFTIDHTAVKALVCKPDLGLLDGGALHDWGGVFVRGLS